MKTTSNLAAGMLTIGVAFSLNVMAGSNSSDFVAGTSAKQSEAKPKMKPHSHMEEKNGLVAKAPAEDKPVVAKKNPANDLSKHFHPRDGGK